MLKIVGILLMIFLVVIVIGGLLFVYNNLYWYKKDAKKIVKAGAVEKQVRLPNGNVINYGEIDVDAPTLLLIHGQMGAWEDYACVLEELAKKWHVYAVDIYGHGESSHNEEMYYINKNGDDLIWFIKYVIGEKTVVSGHSNGALIAAYIGRAGDELIAGIVLEDPPVFSTQGEGWEESFAYLDTYKVLHDYQKSC